MTANDLLWIVVHDPSLPGGAPEPVVYQPSSGQTAVQLASGLVGKINSDSNLQTLGVSAGNVNGTSNVITLASTSATPTSYTQAVTVGSESISLGSSKSAAITVNPATAFAASPILAGGTSNTSNSTNVTVLSGGNTPNAQPASNSITISGATGQSFIHDPNGNMINDGTATYDWDCENRLIKITRAAGTPSVSSPFSAGNNPVAAAITPDGSKLLVCNSSDNSVSVFQTSNNQLLATITTNIGTNPSAIAITPDGTQAYVCNKGSGSVSVLNIATNSAPYAAISVASNPAAVAITPDSTQAFVVCNNSSGTVYIINTLPNTVTTSVNVGTNPSAIAMGRNGFAYVVNSGSANVSAINTSCTSSSCYNVTTIGVGNRPNAIAVAPNQTQVYVCNGTDNTVSVINLSTNNVSTISTPAGAFNSPSAVAFSYDSSTAFVANSATSGAGSNSVSIINTANNTVTNTLSVGTAPGAIVVPEGGLAYVANTGGNSVSAINYSTNTVSSLTVGTSPVALAQTPDATQVYCVNSGSANVSDINTAQNSSTFVYDPTGNKAKFVELSSISGSNTLQFVYCGARMCEQRDGSGSLSNGKQFFRMGQVNFASGTGTSYPYNLDHLGNTREVTDANGNVVTRYSYDPFGKATETFVSGSVSADFQYAGYYFHGPSKLNFTATRAYNSPLGRWLSRDPIGEAGGVNLYGYVGNNPISLIDPSGLKFVYTSSPTYNAQIDVALGKIMATGNEHLIQMLITLEASSTEISFHPGNEPKFYRPETQTMPEDNAISIRWTPSIWGHTKQPCGDIELPPEELLLHELTHAYDNINNNFGPIPPQLKEVNPLRAENMYRYDTGLPGLRTIYDAPGGFFQAPAPFVQKYYGL